MSKADMLLRKIILFEKLATNPAVNFLEDKARNARVGLSGTFDFSPGSEVTLDPEIGAGEDTISLNDVKNIARDVPQVATDIYGRLTNPQYEYQKQNEQVKKDQPNKRTYTTSDPIWQIRQKIKRPAVPQQSNPPQSQQVAQQPQSSPQQVVQQPSVPVKPANIIDYLIKKYG